MFELWLVWRYLKGQGRAFFNLVSVLAIVGMTLGVAALVVVMSVVSGFETTLKSAVIDVTGHILLIKKAEALDPISELEPRLRKLVPSIESMAAFVHVEGMMAHKGRISGVVVEGFDPTQVDQTLRLKDRIVDGKYDLGTGLEAVPPIILGRALADKLKIKVDDQINVVLPKNSPTAKGAGFVTKLKKFRVAGIADLGMYEYDSRFGLTSAKAAQDLAAIGNVYTGLRIRLTNADLARDASFTLASELGAQYLTRDWLDSNHNLFEAIRLEKSVIFIVMLFMTVAACFNISSTLFISVLRRYGDISVFKTLGATRMRLVKFFSLQGLVIGALGAGFGLLLGFLLCELISRSRFIYVPAEIYHLRYLPVEFRPGDFLLIGISSFVLCLLSTLAPAFRGANLNPVEGLKYD